MLIERLCLILLGGIALALAESAGVIQSHRAAADFALTSDPDAAPWKGIGGIFMDHGPKGEAVPGHRTEVRSRWTKDNVYFLFVCPYDALHLHPNPRQTSETNQLWDWDVAEVFVGTDFAHIRKYKEFVMSPQGEWVDLDIDRDSPRPEDGWRWNSGCGESAHRRCKENLVRRDAHSGEEHRSASAGGRPRDAHQFLPLPGSGPATKIHRLAGYAR
jgi:hypothetical protein